MIKSLRKAFHGIHTKIGLNRVKGSGGRGRAQQITPGSGRYSLRGKKKEVEFLKA